MQTKPHDSGFKFYSPEEIKTLRGILLLGKNVSQAIKLMKNRKYDGLKAKIKSMKASGALGENVKN